MKELLTNYKFWITIGVLLIAFILIFMVAVGRVSSFTLNKQEGLKVEGGLTRKQIKEQKKQERSERAKKAYQEKKEKERKELKDSVLGLVISVSSIENKLFEQISEIKRTCLASQLKFAKKRLSSTRDEIYQRYRELDKSNIDKTGLQMFGLVFDKDYDNLMDSVFDTIEENHLAEKSDIEFQEYLRINCVKEVSELKRKCLAYYAPIDIKIVEKIVEEKSDVIFRSVEASIQNAKIESIKKRDEIEKAREEAEETKQQFIKIYFPGISEEKDGKENM